MLRELGEIAQQARFPDARFALDEHEAANPALGFNEPIAKDATLRVPTDHFGGAVDPAAIQHPDRAIWLDRR